MSADSHSARRRSPTFLTVSLASDVSRGAMGSRRQRGVSLPRFHVDMADDDGHFDEVRVEFGNTATMRRQARAMVGEQTSLPGEPWRRIVRDETRGLVATLTCAAR